MKLFPILTTITLAALLSIGTASLAQAGGGQFHPVNFSYGQVVSGRLLPIEVTIMDDAMNGPASGEEFQIVAHNDLPGSGCQTSQKIADGQGLIKGSCKADVNGRFVFEIQPVTKNKVQNGVTMEVYFTDQPSSTGFSDQGSKSVDKYEGVIVHTPTSVNLGEKFTIEVKLKKDGQVLSDSSQIQSVIWTTMKGGLITHSGVDGNRQMTVSVDQTGTVVSAKATLKSGETLNVPSKSIVVKMAASPKPVVSASAQPKASAVPEVKKMISASASPSASTAPEITPSPVATPQPAPEQPAPKKWWQRFMDRIIFWK